MCIHIYICIYIYTGWWYTFSLEQYDIASWNDRSQYMWENNNMIQTVPNHQPVYVLIWIEMLESLTCYEMVGTPVHHHMRCILYFKLLNKWLV